MTTAVKEKEQIKTRTWPELRQIPNNALRVPLIIPKGVRIKMPKGCTTQVAVSPPAEAWPRIMEGIEDFGLHRLSIYAPKEAFAVRADPAIIAEKDGKFYLIVSWE